MPSSLSSRRTPRLSPEQGHIAVVGEPVGERSMRPLQVGLRTPDAITNRALHVGAWSISPDLAVLHAEVDAYQNLLRTHFGAGSGGRRRSFTAKERLALLDGLSERRVVGWYGRLAPATSVRDVRSTPQVGYWFVGAGLLSGLNPMPADTAVIEDDVLRPSIGVHRSARLVLGHDALLNATYVRAWPREANPDAIRIALQPELWAEIAAQYVLPTVSPLRPESTVPTYVRTEDPSNETGEDAREELDA